MVPLYYINIVLRMCLQEERADRLTALVTRLEEEARKRDSDLAEARAQKEEMEFKGRRRNHSQVTSAKSLEPLTQPHLLNFFLGTIHCTKDVNFRTPICIWRRSKQRNLLSMTGFDPTPLYSLSSDVLY